MIAMTLEKLCQIVSGKMIAGNPHLVIQNVSTDSRERAANCLFIPIKGERFDGHDYIEMAQEKGAVAILTEKELHFPCACAVVRVHNTLKALQAIAKWVRETVDIPVVAVTGSSGKTTTKEMIFTVLNDAKKTLKNLGNLNNNIGLPKTLLRLENEHECAVVELGMNHAKEISCLSRIAQPNIGVITNIGVSHIENLGSRENIYKAKMEMIEGMNEDGALIVNADDDFLSSASGEFKGRTITYGLNNPNATIRAINVKNLGIKGITYTLLIDNQPVKQVHIRQPGRYNVYNSLAAIAVGITMNQSIDQVVKSIKNYTPEKMRFNILEQTEKKIWIIDDTYNANPDSTKAALKAASTLRQGRIIAVLGDMLELGAHAKQGHEQVGECVANLKFDQLMTYGELSQYTCDAAIKAGLDNQHVYSFRNREALHMTLEKIIQENDMILVKGSRGMRMEQTVKYLLEERGDKK